jgi:pimeloyl-ACP methyl ester carboxylesterase
VDYQEWYFPARLSLDIAAVGLEAPAWAVARGLRLTRLSEVKLPFLVVAGGRGIVTDPGSFKPLERKLGRALEVRTLPGMTHLDVLSARVNPLAGWVVEFAR